MAGLGQNHRHAAQGRHIRCVDFQRSLIELDGLGHLARLQVDATKPHKGLEIARILGQAGFQRRDHLSPVAWTARSSLACHPLHRPVLGHTSQQKSPATNDGDEQADHRRREHRPGPAMTSSPGSGLGVECPGGIGGCGDFCMAASWVSRSCMMSIARASYLLRMAL